MQLGMSCMTARSFVDTNVLIYAFDSDAGDKNIVANRTLQELWNDQTGIVSPQVLQEFYVNITRKIAKPLTKPKARSIVADYEAWCISMTATEISTAFRIEEEARINFWDALICASALKAGAERILSEDLNSGQKIAGILVENPFLVGK
jgi:predicted nucleic acid-binding protein